MEVNDITLSVLGQSYPFLERQLISFQKLHVGRPGKITLTGICKLKERLDSKRHLHAFAN